MVAGECAVLVNKKYERSDRRESCSPCREALYCSVVLSLSRVVPLNSPNVKLGGLGRVPSTRSNKVGVGARHPSQVYNKFKSVASYQPAIGQDLQQHT